MNGFKNLRPFLVVLAVATVFLLTFFILSLFAGKDKEPQPAPDITGVTADGTSLYSLSEGLGKPCALIFFDLETRHSQELMQALIPAAAEKGVDVMAVCLDAESVEQGLARMEELEMPQAPHTLFDLDGEMAKAYNLSRQKTLLKIKLPCITPGLISTCVNSLGLAWKSGVAAEVICLPNISLGTMLWQGKGNVNFDEVYAVTLTVVVLSVIIEILFKFLCNKYLERIGGISND